jgi:hypothetical protein
MCWYFANCTQSRELKAGPPCKTSSFCVLLQGIVTCFVKGHKMPPSHFTWIYFQTRGIMASRISLFYKTDHKDICISSEFQVHYEEAPWDDSHACCSQLVSKPTNVESNTCTVSIPSRTIYIYICAHIRFAHSCHSLFYKQKQKNIINRINHQGW